MLLSREPVVLSSKGTRYQGLNLTLNMEVVMLLLHKFQIWKTAKTRTFLQWEYPEVHNVIFSTPSDSHFDFLSASWCLCNRAKSIEWNFYTFRQQRHLYTHLAIPTHFVIKTMADLITKHWLQLHTKHSQTHLLNGFTHPTSATTSYGSSACNTTL